MNNRPDPMSDSGPEAVLAFEAGRDDGKKRMRDPKMATEVTKNRSRERIE
jgi:hypothetical protein